MSLLVCHNQWIVLYVRPNSELFVAEMLRNKGYEQFVPVSQNKRLNLSKRNSEPKPLFTGYVFCRYRDDIRWPIVTTPGVINILKMTGQIATIEDETICSIRRVEAHSTDLRAASYLSPGQRVVVVSGPLKGIKGKLVDVRSKTCLVLSLDVMQRSISAQIDRHAVVAIEPPMYQERASNLPSAYL